MNWWYAQGEALFINLALVGSIKADADAETVFSLTLTGNHGFYDSMMAPEANDTLMLFDEDAAELALYLRGCCPLQQRERWQQESKVRA